jgi:hypothetical protein
VFSPHRAVEYGTGIAQSAKRLTTGWSSSPGRGEIFLSSTSSISVLGPTQPVGAAGWFCGRVKRPGFEAQDSPTCGDVKNT